MFVGSVECFYKFSRLGTIKLILRHINTSSAKLKPRGLRASTLSQISEDENQENLTQSVECHSGSENLKSATGPATADPVVLKYTNFLNSIRKGPVQEKVYDTSFGNIRFDTENVPIIHGQFDGIQSEEISENKTKEFDQRTVTNDKCVNDDNQKEINFIDQMWFGETYENYKETSNKSITDKVSKSSHNNPSIHSDLNFVDESIFGEAYTATHNHDKSHQPSNSSFDVNQGKEKISTDLGYIDQNYFNESLDMMNESNKPSIEFSTIRTDFENAILDIDDENDMGSEKLCNEENVQNLNKLNSTNANIDDGIPQELSNIAKIKEFYLNPTGLNDVKTDFEKAIMEPDNENKEDLSDFNIKIEGQSNIDSTDNNYSLSKKEEVSHSQINATTEFSKTKPEHYQRIENQENCGEKTETAYDYVMKMRKKQELEESNEIISDESTLKNYEKIIKSLNNLEEKSHYDVFKLLKKSIIYDKYDIVGLYKPYGMTMHSGTTGSKHVLLDYLEDLAKALKVPKLYTLHRLDAQTTGVLLLAKTPEMAEKLKEMFKNRRLTKTYIAITKGIPSKSQGILDIPIAEGMIEGRRRMALRPNVKGFKNPRGASKLAITKYKVLSSVNSSSLIEVVPVTGVKHQIRVHLGFGLATPVLGDHKYSHLKKIAPQRLGGDILEHLQIPQSRVRKLPMFLHAKSIFIPEVIDGRNVSIQAALPPYFTKAIRMLELQKSKSKHHERSENTITML